MNFTDSVIKLFMQLSVIIISCRFITYFGRKYFKQTGVVCEMITGVLLGPSFLGLISPTFQNWLFPKDPILLADGSFIPHPSMTILYAISQIGLILYMFLTGMEFNVDLIKNRIRSAWVVSSAGIIFPFLLGVIFILFLPDSYNLFQGHIATGYKGFFLGVALSITAFPMMARILEEDQISKTHFGTLALAAGSLDDIFAWIFLAALLAAIKGNMLILLFAVLGTVIYVLFLVFFRKYITYFFDKDFTKTQEFTTRSFSATIILVLICSLATEKIGIYLVFGSFLAGVIMPRGKFADQIRLRCFDLVSTLFLPTFFVFSGLNTQIALLNGHELWIITLLILGIAILGKGVGCALAARVVGEDWRTSITIGTLMNARGLMELIAINIGLQANIITPTLYTILVIVAIVTTLIASPIYRTVIDLEQLKNKE